MSDFWKNVFAGVVATIIGGILLTFLLFAFDEWVRPKPNITGEWVIETYTTQSNYLPFKYVKEEFKLDLLQKGNEILGSGEKVKETDLDGKVIVFNPERRVRLDVAGYMERNYIKTTKVNFNIIEHGERAPSTNTFFLTVDNSDNLTGSFISTVSNTKGTVHCHRNDEKP